MCSIIIYVFVLCLQLIRAQKCPPPEDILKCFCWETNGDAKTFCSRITSLDELKNSVYGFCGSKLSSFSIKDCEFEFLPYDIFKNLTINHLKIANSNFSRIGNSGDPQFYGQERSLESLTFENTFTKQHPFAYVSMEHLNALRTLDLRRCHVEVVHNEWFKRGPKNLNAVRFVEGNIRAVGHSAFKYLINLKIIDLSDNKISYISRSALPEPALRLEELNLERNKLESLPEDIFRDMPNLKTVNLELNEISTIDETTWMPVWNQLKKMNVDYNPMICDSKIKWIYNMKQNLNEMLIATCYKPFILMERDLHSLRPEELK